MDSPIFRQTRLFVVLWILTSFASELLLAAPKKCDGDLSTVPTFFGIITVAIPKMNRSNHKTFKLIAALQEWQTNSLGPMRPVTEEDREAAVAKVGQHHPIHQA